MGEIEEVKSLQYLTLKLIRGKLNEGEYSLSELSGLLDVLQEYYIEYSELE